MAGGAVVTGAAGGLGLEIARVLAPRGLTVHLTDIDAAAVADAAATIGGGAFASALDVRDREACEAVARATVERAGSLSVWVNNAGVLVPGSAWEQSEADQRLMLDVNALGTINGTLAALEQMRAAASGQIINIVSLAGIVAAPGEAVYTASKHAAIGFSLAALTDLRREGVEDIHISCLCPDGIWTPMLHDKLDDPHAQASFIGTMLLPGDVAARAGALLDRPRPVTAIPAHRGALARFFDTFPRLALRSMPLVLASARAKQSRLKKRVEAGKWPPS